MEMSRANKLLELQIKLIYNVISESEKLEFEELKSNLKQSALGSLNWFKQDNERLRKMYMGDLLLK